MAVRPVFVVSEKKPFYSVWNCEFAYNSGFSVTQKQKNITAIHNKYKSIYERRILEVSTKSLQDAGIKLSAFNLLKFVPELGKSVPVECIYQGSKVFERGGPYTDLYSETPRAAKKDDRLLSSGKITAFRFNGVDYPTEPKNAFYDFLYISALLENKELLEEVVKYDAFTDIEFNPNASINCQARATAIVVSLARLDRLDICTDFNEFASLFKSSASLVRPAPASEEDKEKEEEISISFEVGQKIKHPVYGEGCITLVGETTMKAKFGAEEKTLSVKWVAKNCTVQ